MKRSHNPSALRHPSTQGISNHLPTSSATPTSLSHPPISRDIAMKLPGFTGSSSVSVSVEPSTSLSTITLGSAYRLHLSPLFNRFGRYVCDIPLSVPTRSGCHTSNVSLECSHTPRDAEIILGSDWISACSAVLRDDGSGLEDPALSVISSLPAGHYWSPGKGMTTAYINCAVD